MPSACFIIYESNQSNCYSAKCSLYFVLFIDEHLISHPKRKESVQHFVAFPFNHCSITRAPITFLTCVRKDLDYSYVLAFGSDGQI